MDGSLTVLNLQNASRSTEDPKKSQDLARAGLVMAGACLDATVKEVIRSALYHHAETRELVRKKVQNLAKEMIAEDLKGDGHLITKALLSDEPWAELLSAVAHQFTGRSLQNTKWLRRVHDLFGVSFQETKRLEDAFKARNEIVHQMDAHERPKFSYEEPPANAPPYFRPRAIRHDRIDRDPEELCAWGSALLEVLEQLLRNLDGAKGDRVDESSMGMRVGELEGEIQDLKDSVQELHHDINLISRYGQLP